MRVHRPLEGLKIFRLTFERRGLRREDDVRAFPRVKRIKLRHDVADAPFLACLVQQSRVTSSTGPPNERATELPLFAITQ